MGEMGNNSLALSRYCQLEIGSTLCDNLRHKTVVEFPILHVVMREESNISTYKGNVDPAWRGITFADYPCNHVLFCSGRVWKSSQYTVLKRVL